MRTVRYLGDIREEDIKSPKVFSVSQKSFQKMKKLKSELQRVKGKNQRLEYKIEKLEDSLSYLKSNGFISSKALENIQVNIIPI